MSDITYKQLALIVSKLVQYSEHDGSCIGGEKGPCNCGLEDVITNADALLEALNKADGVCDKSEPPL